MGEPVKANVIRPDVSDVARHLRNCFPSLVEEEQEALAKQFLAEFDEGDAFWAYLHTWIEQPRHEALQWSKFRGPR